jgi:hypothetical protein
MSKVFRLYLMLFEMRVYENGKQVLRHYASKQFLFPPDVALLVSLHLPDTLKRLLISLLVHQTLLRTTIPLFKKKQNNGKHGVLSRCCMHVLKLLGRVKTAPSNLRFELISVSI